mmetsp:Transcript_38817/g.124435  ORF Transcript_38817/g.124435 Transcript_38817/m.124435 type:complete len:286 (-) Transcript_38817:494-1351(-)
MLASGLTIGVIGVGTISSACVRGLCGGPTQLKFVVSPRNSAKASALASDFGERISIAASNQGVLDAADVVFVAVLSSQAEAVLGELRFRESHRVISLMAGVDLASIERWTSPAKRRAIAIPLPIVAERRGVTLVVPPDPVAKALFDDLGAAVCVDDEDQFRRMQCLTCVVGDLYERQRTAFEWLAGHDVPREAAAAYVGAIFHSMTDDSKNADPATFGRLVDEQTPGGLNEMVINEQRDDANYQALAYSLDSLYSRISGNPDDPNLKPKNRRRRAEENDASAADP